MAAKKIGQNHSVKLFYNATGPIYTRFFAKWSESSSKTLYIPTTTN